jgi:hypothetical protein
LINLNLSRGKRQLWPKPRAGGGGALLYSNYRTQIWKPILGIGIRILGRSTTSLALHS